MPPQAASLEQVTGAAWIVHLDPMYQVIDYAAPKDAAVTLPSGSSPAARVLAFLAANRTIFAMDDPKSEFTIDHVDTNDPDTGGTHVRFQQVVGGVPVESMVWIAHLDASGDLTEMSGQYVPNLGALSLTPKLTADQAIAAAEDDVTGSGSDFTDDDLGTPTSSLQVFAAKGTPRLAWVIDLPVGFDRRHLEIDAQTGAVLSEVSTVHTKTAMASGSLHFAPYNKTDAKSIVVSDDGKTMNGKLAVGSSSVGLHTVRGGKAATKAKCAAAAKVKNGEITNTSTTDGQWSDATSPGGEDVDAQYYAGSVVQFYQAQYGWLSYDGKGSTITSIINQNCTSDDDRTYSFDPTNAYWDGESAMHYGDGDTKGNYPTSASSETVAHELSHGVTQFTSKLGGTDSDTQPGAINEANSDIQAAFYSHDVLGQDDAHAFLFSEDGDSQGLACRDMIHPVTNTKTQYGVASGYAEVSKAGTKPEVHDGSTVVSHAFYLYTHGGVHDTNKRPVSCGIGWPASQKLWWQVQSHYMRSTEHYDTLAMHTISAAKELKLPLQSIACAWVAVGGLTDSWVQKNLSITCAKAGGADAGTGSDAGSSSSDGGVSLTTSVGPLVQCTETSLVSDGGTSLTK